MITKAATMHRPLVTGYTGSYKDRCTTTFILGAGYRFYSPALMRFTSSDDWSPFGIGGLNPYSYCSDDPIDFSDPSGHAPWGWIGKMMRRVSALWPDGSIAAAHSTTDEDRIGLIIAYREEVGNGDQLRQHYDAGARAATTKTNQVAAVPAQAATSTTAAEPAVTAASNKSASDVRLAPSNTNGHARLTGVEGLGPRLVRSNSLYGRYPAFGGHGLSGPRLWHEHLFFLKDRLRSLRVSKLDDDAREEMWGRIRSDIEDTFDALVRDRPQPPGVDAQTAFDHLLPY